jgi:ABC-type multidrug transport system fused ATPase/permease subunit
VIPSADTPEDRAAAYGFRLKAQELLDQSNLHRASARARREWRRAWKRQHKAWARNWHDHWRRHWDRNWHNWDRYWEHRAAQTQAAMAAGAGPINPFGHVLLGITLPVFALANAALFVALILVLISAVMTGGIFGWPLPANLPLWGSLLIVCAIYIVLTSPLRAARHGAHLAWGPYYHTWSTLSSIFWLGFTALFLWLAYRHLPQVHALLDQLPSFWQKQRMPFAV